MRAANRKRAQPSSATRVVRRVQPECRSATASGSLLEATANAKQQSAPANSPRSYRAGCSHSYPPRTALLWTKFSSETTRRTGDRRATIAFVWQSDRAGDGRGTSGRSLLWNAIVARPPRMGRRGNLGRPGAPSRVPARPGRCAKRLVAGADRGTAASVLLSGQDRRRDADGRCRSWLKIAAGRCAS